MSLAGSWTELEFLAHSVPPRPLPVAQVDCAPWKKNPWSKALTYYQLVLLPTSWLDVSMTMYNTTRRGEASPAAMCLRRVVATAGGSNNFIQKKNRGARRLLAAWLWWQDVCRHRHRRRAGDGGGMRRHLRWRRVAMVEAMGWRKISIWRPSHHKMLAR